MTRTGLLVKCRSCAWLLAVPLIGLAVGCSSSGSAKSTNTGPQTTAATTTAATSPAPTTTEASAPASPNGKAAIIGSSPDVVRARLGERDAGRSGKDSDVFGRCDSATQKNLYQFSVQYQENHAISVNRQTCDAVSKDENLAEALLYVPGDAHRVGSVAHGTPGEDDYTYSSQALSSLPADLFVGCKAGSFIVAVDSSGWGLATVGCNG